MDRLSLFCFRLPLGGLFTFQAALNRVDTEPLCGGSAVVKWWQALPFDTALEPDVFGTQFEIGSGVLGDAGFVPVADAAAGDLEDVGQLCAA